jgi:hypothetical protein
MCPKVDSTRSNDASSNGLDIALDPLDLETGRVGLGLALLEQLGNEVEPGDGGAGTRRGQGGIAGAACDVEYPHRRADPGASGDALADVGNVPGECVVVAGSP